MNSVQKYIEYHRNNALHKEIDTHLDAAVWIADRLNMTVEQRYWFAFLNACSETTPTAFVMFDRYKEPASDIIPYVLDNRQLWKFQYDVRWILYKFEAVCGSYLSLTSGGQKNAISSANVGSTQKERFNALTSRFKVHAFGTYVFFLYTELLHYLCGEPAAVNLDFRTNHSVRNGLIYALGLEGFGLTKKGEKPNEMLIETLEEGFKADIYDKVQRLDIPDRYKTLWSIETTLCTFNKFNHGRRWLGFYRQRQRNEILAIEKNFGLSLSSLWEYRLQNWGEERSLSKPSSL